MSVSTLKRDMYKTPHWCYEALAPYISLISGEFKTTNMLSALEPCAGDNRITKWLSQQGFDTDSNEPSLAGGVDFCTINNQTNYDLILSNPPFSIAQDMVEHGLSFRATNCWLLRLSFLASQKRYNMYRKYPLDALYILTNRPSFDGKGTDNSEYAWFIWDRKNIFNKHGIVHL